MRITKIHSLGNDFLILEEPPDLDIKALALRICDRHTGVGADGLILIHIKDKSKRLVDFRIFNADGSEAEISGNGVRTAAAYLYRTGHFGTSNITFITPAGEREGELLESKENSYLVKIDMGAPKFRSDEIPFNDGTIHDKIIDYPLFINQKILNLTVVSMGNPHCGIFVDRFPSRIEWNQIGLEIESHPFFPNRTNIEFIRVLNRKEIEVLFWERGVGETLSSGSGSSAAVVASHLKGLTERTVTVHTSMGKLFVEWGKETVKQSGPAVIIFDGEYYGSP